jgi:hypothetical protein
VRPELEVLRLEPAGDEHRRRTTLNAIEFDLQRRGIAARGAPRTMARSAWY